MITDISAPLAGVGYASVAWGDFDNRGDLDIVLSWFTGSTYVSKVFRNNGGEIFTDIGAAMSGLRARGAAWGDFDNDGRLDVLLAGDTGSPSCARVFQVWRSVAPTANTAPAAPADLAAVAGTGQLTFSWTASSDGATPPAGLTYDIRVGTSAGGSQVAPAMAAGDSGYRRVVALGNTGQRTSAVLTGLTPGVYYWSVQAIDGAFAGSPFATEGTASLCGGFAIDPISANVIAGGGGGAVSVTGVTGCGWTAASNDEWITVNSGSESGLGSGTVNYTVAANPLLASRIGTITIAGETFTVSQAGVITITSLTANQAFPSPAGTPLTRTAVATGGAAPLQYQFWVDVPGAGWTNVRPYSTDASATWTPSFGGAYRIQVWGRTAGSVALYDAYSSVVSFSVSGAAPLIVSGVTATAGGNLVTFPVAAGTPLTWTATGGVAPLQYQFWLEVPGIGWTRLQDYGTSASAPWTPTHGGNYRIQVWAKSAGSVALYDAYSNAMSFSVTGTAPLLVTGLTATSGGNPVTSPVAPGTPLTWTASTTGASRR